MLGMAGRYKLAGAMLCGVAQTAPRLGDPDRNLAACLERLEEAAALGCKLVVLPECALSGYMFETAAEAAPHAEDIPGPATDALAQACARLGLHCVVGILERDGDVLRNSAVLLGPPGSLLGRYRKTHLPFLGVDRFTVPGDEPYEVWETPLGRIGIEVCYDLRFPEVTRALALAGADVVAHPTNWPAQAKPLADFVTRARAAENHVFLLTANRIGVERESEFFGWSQVVDPFGRRLAEAGDGDELIVAEIDPSEAREKDLAAVPGRYEVHLFDDRRPDLYGALVVEAERMATG
jgi:predicted amidohydrolase